MGGPVANVVPPLIAPLLSGSGLSVSNLRELVRQLVGKKIRKLFVLNAAKRTRDVDCQLHRRVVGRAYHVGTKELPILIYVSSASVMRDVRLTRMKTRYNTSTMISTPPCCFTPKRPRLTRFCRSLVPRLPLPVFLCGVPSRAGIGFTPTAVRHVTHGPRIIKFGSDSTGTICFRSIVCTVGSERSFTVLIKPRRVATRYILLNKRKKVGKNTGVFPRLCMSLCRTTMTHSVRAMDQLRPLIVRVDDDVCAIKRRNSDCLGKLGYTLSLLNIYSSFITTPFRHFGIPRHRGVHGTLRTLPFYPRLGPWVLNLCTCR